MTPIIFVLIIIGVFSLWQAFRPEQSQEKKAQKSFEVLNGQVNRATTLKELNRLDDQANDFYERYTGKVEYPFLNERFKILIDGIEYKRTTL